MDQGSAFILCHFVTLLPLWLGMSWQPWLEGPNLFFPTLSIRPSKDGLKTIHQTLLCSQFYISTEKLWLTEWNLDNVQLQPICYKQQVKWDLNCIVIKVQTTEQQSHDIKNLREKTFPYAGETRTENQDKTLLNISCNPEFRKVAFFFVP